MRRTARRTPTGKPRCKKGLRKLLQKGSVPACQLKVPTRKVRYKRPRTRREGRDVDVVVRRTPTGKARRQKRKLI